ncbi:MAG: hypothetical protein GC201_01050 [Alphaproteobacteria bacterium]|nr:hypothetical protein [Alphaproteobacteria bacterium]
MPDTYQDSVGVWRGKLGVKVVDADRDGNTPAVGVVVAGSGGVEAFETSDPYQDSAGVWRDPVPVQILDAGTEFHTDPAGAVRAAVTMSGISVFDPSALFTGSEEGGWYDPSDLTTLFQDSAGTVPVAADGDPVGKMLDKSGNGRHLTAAADAARPTFHTSGGLSWIEGDGSNDRLSSASFALAQPMERISAVRSVTWSNLDRLFGGLGNYASLYQNGTAPTLGMTSGAPVLSFTGPAVGADGIVSERYNGASSRAALNAGAWTTADVGNNAADGFQIFDYANPAVATRPANARCYGVVVICRLLTDTEIDQTRAWLAAKAGVTL